MEISLDNMQVSFMTAGIKTASDSVSLTAAVFHHNLRHYSNPLCLLRKRFGYFSLSKISGRIQAAESLCERLQRYVK